MWSALGATAPPGSYKIRALLNIRELKKVNDAPRTAARHFFIFPVSLTNFTNTHVVLTSAKPFTQAIKDIQAEMGRASTEVLGDKLSASKDFAEFEEEMTFLAGRSNFINVGLLNWGKVMSRVPISMKAVLFVIGNPLTAKKLLEAGGPEVGLYLPTKIYVYEDTDGVTKVTYDQLSPVMAQYDNPQLATVAAAIDKALANLADKAAN